MQKFYANGKLLLTGEYLVLDGALAIALPTKLGQSLTVEPNQAQKLVWESQNSKSYPWFQHSYTQLHQKIDDNPIAERLRIILLQAQKQNPAFINSLVDNVTTKLTFPRNWGLGTSSTLISLIAQWAKCNPYELLFEAFGGSGYDIACAEADSPISYQLQGKNNPVFEAVDFNPSFKDQLYFVYLDKKQNNKKGIARYRAKGIISNSKIQKISTLSTELIHLCELNAFEKLLKEHESIVSELIGFEKVQSIYFSDYWGLVKSLGAWGGDFVLATSSRSFAETKKYFNEKGFNVFLKYSELIKTK
ncbi:MAG: GYDIA family GHMP kinase [Saprospiraceae bacterium]